MRVRRVILASSIVRATANLWSSRALILRLTGREVEARFRGSLLGLLWAVLLPLIMLTIYAFVFGSIFGSHWSRPQAAHAGTANASYPLILFAGLIVFGVFSETVTRAPGLVLENSAYVKKVIFPLEVLPVVALINAAITGAISLLLLLIAYTIQNGLPPATALLLPFLLLPLIFITLGVTCFLASLGVFLRDLRHILPPLTTAMLFLSPVFYPVEAVPEPARLLIYLNPLSPSISAVRDALFWGALPDPLQWLGYLCASLIIYALGMLWFMRTRKAFADVV
jgi:lipopolysaccharide transport system permease protein